LGHTISATPITSSLYSPPYAAVCCPLPHPNTVEYLGPPPPRGSSSLAASTTCALTSVSHHTTLSLMAPRRSHVASACSTSPQTTRSVVSSMLPLVSHASTKSGTSGECKLGSTMPRER